MEKVDARERGAGADERIGRADVVGAEEVDIYSCQGEREGEEGGPPAGWGCAAAVVASGGTVGVADARTREGRRGDEAEQEEMQQMRR